MDRYGIIVGPMRKGKVVDERFRVYQVSGVRVVVPQVMMMKIMRMRMQVSRVDSMGTVMTVAYVAGRFQGWTAWGQS